MTIHDPDRGGDVSDFDFLVGEWVVTNERLRRPLTGRSDWYETTADARSRTMLNGAVSIDEMRYEDFSALTLRLYAHSTGKWTIHWVNGQSGLLQTPVAGTWTNGELTAVGEDEFVGRAILGSYRWWQIAASSARWEQAFSVDDGQTWETNDMFLG